MSNAHPSTHIPNIRRLEIHITYRCNLRCTHCSNNISQAPSQEIMPAERIENLLNESARLNWLWDWLVLHGGEPTLHPEFERICALLADYKKRSNPAVNLFVCTNGHGEFVRKQLAVTQQYGITNCNSDKNGSPLIVYHVPLSVSPEDCGEDYYLGCFQTSRCGISYTNSGFYECSPAGASERLFGYPPLVAELKDLTAEKLAEGFKVHCKHCGYSRLQLIPHPDAPMSKTWLEAIERYKNRHETAH
jgi:hypothetical protein